MIWMGDRIDPLSIVDSWDEYVNPILILHDDRTNADRKSQLGGIVTEDAHVSLLYL